MNDQQNAQVEYVDFVSIEQDAFQHFKAKPEDVCFEVLP